MRFEREIERLRRKVHTLRARKGFVEIPEDPVEFFKKILRITPYAYQAEFLSDPYPLKVLRWCRRAGKTTVMSGSDLHFAFLNPGARIIVTMPKFQQVKEIYFQGEGGLHQHLARMDKDLYEKLIYDELQTIIRCRNKAVIMAETPEAFTIRGHGPRKISCLPRHVNVMLSDGRKIPVCKIKLGQEIITYNISKGIVEPKRVLNVFRNSLAERKIVRIFHEFGHLDCTEDHKIFTLTKGFVPATHLIPSERSLYHADIILFEACPQNEVPLPMETCGKRPLRSNTDAAPGTVHLWRFIRRLMHSLAKGTKTKCSPINKPLIKASRVCSIQILDNEKLCENTSAPYKKSRLGKRAHNLLNLISSAIHRNLSCLLSKWKKNYFSRMVIENSFSIRISDLVHGRWRPHRPCYAHKHSRLLERRADDVTTMAWGTLGNSFYNKRGQKRKRFLSGISCEREGQIFQFNQGSHYSKHEIQDSTRSKAYSMCCMWRTFSTQKKKQLQRYLLKVNMPWKILLRLQTHITKKLFNLRNHIYPESPKCFSMQQKMQTYSAFSKKSRKEKVVYDLEVEDNHNFFADGVLVSNCDEMNFIRKDRDLWLSALLPMTLTRTVYINVASTPWNKDSIYHKMCFDKSFKIFSGNVHEHDPPRYLRTWRDVLKPNGPLDPKQVDIMREQYAGDPWRWKREMECAFVDDETAFLPSSLIIKCQNEELEFAKFEDNITGNFYIGWDLGRERDHNAVSVVDKKADVCRLVHCKRFPLGTPYVTVMAYIKSICDRWKTVHAVYYDHTGTKGINEQIEKAGFPGLRGVDFTRPTKHGMAMSLKQLMMTSRKTDAGLLPKDARRRFELPFDRDVQAELNVVQWEQSPGSEIYVFSHPEGSHDDRFWSTALSIYAATVGGQESRLVRAF